jgi:hypothetical protein
MERTLSGHTRIANGKTISVREASGEDLAGIVTIHQQAFRRFFLTRLGADFLRLYYGLVLEYAAGIVLVSHSEGEPSPDGFV